MAQWLPVRTEIAKTSKAGGDLVDRGRHPIADAYRDHTWVAVKRDATGRRQDRQKIQP
jgi:hypothetical protein